MTKHYNEAFKRDAVQLLEEGRLLKKLAAESGLCPVTLRGWSDRFAKGAASRSPSHFHK
jgi:transposase-like protein